MAETSSSAQALTELEAKPDDLALRERAARALERDGRAADVVALFTGHAVNLTAHSTEGLPCLCRRCIDPATTSASAGGMAFVRAFAVARGRVLYFWMPEEIAGDRAEVCRAVQTGLHGRLQQLDKRRRRGGRGLTIGADDGGGGDDGDDE